MDEYISAWHQFLDRTAQRLADKTAVFADEGALSYRELVEQSVAVANKMLASGIRRGDRVVLLLPNSLALVTALVATSRIGALFSVLHPALKAFNLQHILTDADPKLIITTRDREQHNMQYNTRATVWYQDTLLENSPQRTLIAFPGISQDIACLIYTSGSTGKPKAVVCGHNNIVFAVQAIQCCLQYQESDVIGTFLPFSFDVGLYQLFLTFQVGATLALGRDTHVGPGLLKKLADWRVSVVPAVPSLASTIIRLGKRAAQHLPDVRLLTNTGAHLPQTAVADLQTLFPHCAIFIMFGLTECKRVSILQPADYAQKPDSVGKPLPDTECLIVDAQANVLPAGVEGELVVRGPHVMQGYWKARELTATRFRPWQNSLEHVLFTGDTCMIDEDGYLYFRGRSDDIYKQAGFRISALEIEAAACDIAHVQQAALLVPTGEMGAALFVTGEITEQDIVSELRTRLEDYKLPAHIRVIDAMPLTPNGKVNKKQLRSLLLREVAQR